MHIILGKENIDSLDLSSKFTVLELDTFRLPPDGTETTAFCVVENIPILNLPKVEQMKDLHSNLLLNYRKKDWNYCTQALDFLVGFWGDEVDTFYQTMRERISVYSQQDPGPDWTGVIDKSIS